MKKEITRLSLRTVKKIGKVSVRIQAVQDQLAKVRAAIDAAQQVDEALLEQLEQSPSETSLKEHENDLVFLQSRLQQLNWLEEQFNNSPLKKKSTLTAPELLKLTDEGEQILQYIQELKINENEAEKNKRIEEDANNKKSKKDMSFQKQQQQQQQDQGSRLPYRRYYTESNIEIKVSSSGLHSQPRDSFVLILHFFSPCKGRQTSHRQ
jgi:pyruvate carboxylase